MTEKHSGVIVPAEQQRKNSSYGELPYVAGLLPSGRCFVHAVPTRIVIADCQPATISGVVHELQRDLCMQVIGTARGPRGLIETLERLECDVVVTDDTISSGREAPGDGVEMLSLIQRDHPDVGLVVFTMIENPAVISSLLTRGVSCIFSKRDDLDEMSAAVRAAEAKDEYLSPVIASIVRRARTGKGGVGRCPGVDAARTGSRQAVCFGVDDQ